MTQEHRKTPRTGDRCRGRQGERFRKTPAAPRHSTGVAVSPEWWVLAVVFWLIVSVGCGGHSAMHTPSLVSLQIQSPASTVLLNRSEQLTAVGRFDDGSSQDLTASVTWSSGNTLIALVGDNKGRKGFLTGIGGGSTAISAVSGAISATSSFAVTVPAPRFAYVLNFSLPTRARTITAYTVDPNTGIFTAVPGANVPVAGSFGVSPDGNFLYAPCSPNPSGGGDAICSFTIDRNTGVLQSASTTPPLTQPAASVVISPSGRFLYTTLATATGCGIVGFSIDARTGALTQLPNLAILAGQCGMIAIDPAERFLYSAAPGGDATIAGFNIDQQTGTLTSISGSPFHAPIDVGTTLDSMAMDVAGRSVYYDFNWTVSNLALDGMTGALTPLSGAGTPTKFPCQIATSGRFLYIPDCSFGGISQFSIDPGTGKISGTDDFSTLGIPSVITADPSGNFLYVVNLQLQLEIYSIDSNTGALILSSTMTLGASQVTLLTQLIVIG
jgi:6-phosphogluconolactonase